MSNLYRKTITIDDKLCNKAKKLNPKSKFSEIVREALKEYVEKEKVEEALTLRGKWKLQIEDSIEFVDKLRQNDELRQIDEWRNS